VRALLAGLLTALVTAAAAAPAVAKGPLLLDGDVVRVADRVRGSFTLEGQVTVSYRGRGVEGTTTYRPVAQGDLFASELVTRRSGRLRSLDLFSVQGLGGTTIAQVLRTGADGQVRRCTDARSDRFGALAAGPQRAYTLAVPGQSGLRTRCGGPTADDLAGALPPRELAPSVLAPGSKSVDLRAERAFAGGGFTGTVRSTLVLRLTGLRRQRTISPNPRRRPQLRRFAYTATGGAGELALDMAVPAGAAGCDSLVLCGLAGAQRVSLAGATGRAEVQIARRGGSFGFAQLTGATTGASVRLPDGTSCEESSPAGGATISFRVRRTRIEATLFALGNDTLGLARCPGPSLTDLGALRTLASGSFPRSALGRRAITLRLRGDAAFGGATARGRTRGEVVVVLRRAA
jgi:hypothetical protein